MRIWVSEDVNKREEFHLQAWQVPHPVRIQGYIKNTKATFIVTYRSFAKVRFWGPTGLIKEWRAGEGKTRNFDEQFTLTEPGRYVLEAENEGFGATSRAEATLTAADPPEHPPLLPGTDLGSFPGGSVHVPGLGQVPVLYVAIALLVLFVLIGGTGGSPS